MEQESAEAPDEASVARQALAGEDKGYMKGQKTLEINPRHPIVQELRRQVSPSSASARHTAMRGWTSHASEQALRRSGASSPTVQASSGA